MHLTCGVTILPGWLNDRILQSLFMRKYITGILAILLAGLCLAYNNNSKIQSRCQWDKPYIWYLVDGYWSCSENLNYISPYVLALWGHETMFGQYSTNPRVELEASGWLLTKEEFIESEFGCPGVIDERVCAVSYDPAHINSNTFTKVNINGVWYWRPKEQWAMGPQVACYLCKPNE